MQKFVKCLSLYQPWATFMVHPIEMPSGKLHPPKLNETRSWRGWGDHRTGRLHIHAGLEKSPKKLGYIFEDERIQQLLEKMGYKPDGSDLPRGKILGSVVLEKCEATRLVRDKLNKLEYMLGNYDDGRWAWITRMGMSKQFEEPIPYKGAQQIFNVPEEVIAA